MIPKHLKSAGRVAEKIILSPEKLGHDKLNIFDIVRGMIVVTHMNKIAMILRALHASKDIIITRIKERFFRDVSEGGWRDTMVRSFIREYRFHFLSVLLN